MQTEFCEWLQPVAGVQQSHVLSLNITRNAYALSYSACKEEYSNALHTCALLLHMCESTNSSCLALGQHECQGVHWPAGSSTREW